MPDSRWKLISICTLCEEGDTTCSSSSVTAANFYPRPPRGGRRVAFPVQTHTGQFLSTPSARRATDELPARDAIALFLSTPSAKRATRGVQRGDGEVKISIHALREEGDRAASCVLLQKFLFLSTPSAKRATRLLGPVAPGRTFLSTPSAKRATYVAMFLLIVVMISIHALREEGDITCCSSSSSRHCDFYPRPPRRGRRTVLSLILVWNSISIHALREEGDLWQNSKTSC